MPGEMNIGGLNDVLTRDLLTHDVLTHDVLVGDLDRTRLIFDSLSNGVSISDTRLPDQPLIYVNPAFERMTGYTAAEVLGRNCRFLQGLERDQPALVEMREAIRTGQRVRVKLKNYRKDGQLFWNEVYLSPINPGDRKTHFLGIQNDVTKDVTLLEAAQQAELDAAQKNMEADVFLQGAGEGIYGLDANGLTTFVNPAAEVMIGWKNHELLGRSQHAIIHHSYADRRQNTREECLICNSLRDGLTHREEDEVFWRRDGSSFPVEYTVSPILHNGQAAGAVILFQDITERKRRERADLAASQAKTDFLSNMSHEIRTPMNGIQGMIQLLLLSELTPEQHHYAEVAESSGRTMLALIDDILDVSKIEAGKTVIETLDFGLRRTLNDVVEMWNIQAETKGLVFKVSNSPGAAERLRGDPRRLRQVLNNLISNAIKFTQKGSVSLRVERESEEQDGVMLRFSIIDTGLGLRPDQIRILFQPFVQADISTTRKYGGSGLGLTICKHLVELMGGRIGIESQPGEGSTFWFTMKFERALESSAESSTTDPPTTDPPTTDPHGSESSRTTAVELVPIDAMRPKDLSLAALAQVEGQRPAEQVPHPERILVVEDNPTNRMVVEAQLHKLGYQADAVTHGEECLEALAQTRYQLILMDCEMPVMDGYEATRRIRLAEAEHPDGRRIPIIALTAHAMSGHRETCQEAGMDYFLSKPLDMQRLDRALRQWCLQSASCSLTEHSQSTADPSALVVASLPAARSDALPELLSEQAVAGEASSLKPVRDSGQDAGPQAEAYAVEVFDQHSLMPRLMDDRQIADIILKGFVGDCPSQLEMMRRHFLERDAFGVRLQAHALKGSAAAVSAVRLSEVAFKMESAASDGMMGDCERLLPQTVLAFEQFKATLKVAGWI